MVSFTLYGPALRTFLFYILIMATRKTGQFLVQTKLSVGTMLNYNKLQ
jgi:hypothetical protein